MLQLSLQTVSDQAFIAGTDLRLAQGTCQRLEVQLREKVPQIVDGMSLLMLSLPERRS